MKFEYAEKNEDRECVAIIDAYGAFLIKTDEGCTYICGDEDTPVHGSNNDWDYSMSKVVKKFYHGDKITITF